MWKDGRYGGEEEEMGRRGLVGMGECWKCGSGGRKVVHVGVGGGLHLVEVGEFECSSFLVAFAASSRRMPLDCSAKEAKYGNQ